MEVINIKKACSISDKIFKLLIKELKFHKFKTELDIYIFLKQKTKQHFCKFSFKPIVAFNEAEIHHKATNKELTKGFLIVDFGVKYKGYCSDCTRTFYLGKPTKEEIKLYNLVLLAQETALIHSQPGVYAADIDLISRAALWDYYRNYLHCVGHGIGKQAHQWPVLRPQSKQMLKKNECITIEPGLYFKNKFGIRIEDTIIIKHSPEILTKVTKKLIIIPKFFP